MEKERKVKKLALVAVIVAVLGMTIAFAALSQTLTITGTANMEQAVWDVTFGSISEPIKIGSAKTDYPYDKRRGSQRTAILSDDYTEITDIRATLKKPGDEVRYTTTLENWGTIDAEIASIEMPTLTDAQKEIFDFSVIYTEDGKNVSVGDVLPKCSNFEDGECTEGTLQPITIKVRYKDITDASLLPEEAQTITLSYKINFVQSDKSTLYHAGNQIFGVELSNGQTPVTEGNATVTTPTLVGNTITNFVMSLKDKGDSASYTFDITNLADHAVTVKMSYNKTINNYVEECSNKNLSEYPECSKFDATGDGAVSSSDQLAFNGLIRASGVPVIEALKGSDGTNKIPANSTKTFTISIKIPSDYDGEGLTGEALPLIDGAIITAE